MAEFLDTALALGRRIARRALWDGEQCTWEIRVSQPDPDHRVRIVRAEGALYQGTAGIAWFLGELYRATGEAEVGRAARGGLAYALARELPGFGFHSGRTGIAWVAVRLGEIFERPAYGDAARRLLRSLAGRVSPDEGLDVVAGAGGAIPACLDLAESTGWDELRVLARELGEHLIRLVHRSPEGWSWAGGGESAIRNLTGFAHGASGMALALLELGRATGEGRLRFAAEMAFLYERRLFDEERSNWPDLRHKAIGEYLFFQQTDELRRAVTEATLPPYEPTCATAWCHGAPGIGLARLRAWELTGQEIYRQEAEAALRATLEAVESDLSDGGNYSLCHGIGGNCEVLLLASELFGDPEPRRLAERAAKHGVETYEQPGRPWPCGTVGGEPDASLLVGEAGIGAFYLRLADPETPSILLLRPRTGQVTTAEGARGYQELARESADDFFATTLRAWTRLAPPGPVLPSWPPGSVPIGRAPVEDAYDVLVGYLEETAEDRRSSLADSFEPERIRYELAVEPRDGTRALVRRLVRPAWEEIDVRGSLFTLAPGARLVSTRHDWPAWLEASVEELPPETGVTYLCHPQGNSHGLRRVGPMVALILEVVARVASLDRVVARVAEAAGLAQTDEKLAAKVRVQLRELYLAGFVDTTSRDEH